MLFGCCLQNSIQTIHYHHHRSVYKAWYIFSVFICIYSTVTLPVIIKNPKSQSVDLKNNFTYVLFTCEADGVSSYYWERQNGNIPPGATGINTSNLTIVNLQLKDAGYYRCVAVSSSGSTESEYAKLTLAGMHVCMYITSC